MVDTTTDGRDDAFASAVAAEIDGLYRYARWLVGEDAEAEDLVGDTMLRALE